MGSNNCGPVRRGIALKEPTEYSSKNGELNVTLEFGHVTLPEESTGIRL